MIRYKIRSILTHQKYFLCQSEIHVSEIAFDKISYQDAKIRFGLPIAVFKKNAPSSRLKKGPKFSKTTPDNVIVGNKRLTLSCIREFRSWSRLENKCVLPCVSDHCRVIRENNLDLQPSVFFYDYHAKNRSELYITILEKKIIFSSWFSGEILQNNVRWPTLDEKIDNKAYWDVWCFKKSRNGPARNDYSGRNVNCRPFWAVFLCV